MHRLSSSSIEDVLRGNMINKAVLIRNYFCTENLVFVFTSKLFLSRLSCAVLALKHI